MKRIITDWVDDMKCISLTNKAWDYLSTSVLVISILYWAINSDHGAFFQLTGLVAFVAATRLWIKKNSFAQKFVNGEFDE